MTVDKAQQWLQQNPYLIPALSHKQNEIVSLLELHQHSQKVVQIAVSDPGLCLGLLSKINSNRGPDSARDIVESPQAAIALLGDKVAHTLYKDFSLAETDLTQPHQLFLFQQLINRSLHNETLVEMWSNQLGLQNIEIIKVSALLSYIGELLCCVHDFKNYLRYIKAGANEQQCEQAFGFKFFELTEVLCETLKLPSLITRALPYKQDTGQNATLLNFTSRLCHQYEHGCYSEGVDSIFEQFSEWLESPIDAVISKTHEYTIQAARNTAVANAWQPAARLLLIQDQHWSAPATGDEGLNPQQAKAADKPAASSTSVTPDQVLKKIKSLLHQPSTKQSDVLKTCLQIVIRDFSMSRVSLLLLTPNKKGLSNRMSMGVEKDSPLNKFSIELDKSGLLRILLNKPQAVWINNDSLKKYHKLIPQSFLASTMTDNFLAMSLFMAEKPLGIVYTDRSRADDKISPEAFSQFKNLISVTSKALTLLSKRQQ